MNLRKQETVDLKSTLDVTLARQRVRTWSTELGFSLIDQTKVVTAASELARNTVVYGGGGTMRLESLEDGRKRGLRLVFEDTGPGIADIPQALSDGFTTGGGLGLGLGGAKRLMSEFEIESTPGKGTRISVVRWKM